MAIADIFLKIEGITGEATDAGHAGEINVTSWSWGLHSSVSAYDRAPTGAASLRSLEVVKLVDRSSPALLQYCDTNKVVSKATLTTRKAAGSSGPLDYVVIDLKKVRIVKVDISSQSADLLESLSLTFEQIEFNYTPQGSLGSGASGGISFTAIRPEVG
jgi:type VI secretion system secreted protein Hcp